MSYTDGVRGKPGYIEMDSVAFLNILEGKDNSYINTGHGQKIVLRNIIVTDAVKFPNKIFTLPIEISNCYFEDTFLMWAGTFHSRISFWNCYFDSGMQLSDNLIIKDEILFWDFFSSHTMTISGGEYSAINIFPAELASLELFGGKFEQLSIISGKKNALKSLSIYDSRGIIPAGNIEVSLVDVEQISLSGINSNNYYLFNNISCNCFVISEFTNNGTVKIIGLKPFNLNGEKTSFYLSKSNLGKAEFYEINLSDFDEVNIENSYLSDCIFSNINWKEKITAAEWNEKDTSKETKEEKKSKAEKLLRQVKEALRQLKYVMQKQGDKIQEVKFYSQEMDIHNKLLPWTAPWTNNFWNKIILHASNYFSHYGQSFLRPLIFLLLFNLFFFFILITAFNFKGIEIVTLSKHSWSAFNFGSGEFFNLINPVHKLDSELSGWAIFWDLMSRISSSFFAYNLIRATRRFVR